MLQISKEIYNIEAGRYMYFIIFIKNEYFEILTFTLFIINIM